MTGFDEHGEPLRDARDDEIERLRDYREKTEAALQDLCARAGNSPGDYCFVNGGDLRELGLWREQARL